MRAIPVYCVTLVLAGALGIGAIAGCLTTADDDPADGVDDSFLPQGKGDDPDSFSPAEAQGVLAVVNTVSVTVLDDDVHLDARAAGNIVDHRDGDDGEPDTADDDLFDDLDELDAVPYVGPTAFGRLLDYAQANGYVDATGPDQCIVISEYIEAWGNYNKAVELFNCGTAAAPLSEIGICLVRNDDVSCTVTAILGGGQLDAGQVYTVCRRQTGHPASNDPMAPIRNNCIEELPGVMTFNGDDRLVVFADLDRSGTFGSGDRVLDALGTIADRPGDAPWRDVILRRCNFEPFSGGPGGFDVDDYYETHPDGSAGDFGQPPTAGCAP